MDRADFGGYKPEQHWNPRTFAEYLATFVDQEKAMINDMISATGVFATKDESDKEDSETKKTAAKKKKDKEDGPIVNDDGEVLITSKAKIREILEGTLLYHRFLSDDFVKVGFGIPSPEFRVVCIVKGVVTTNRIGRSIGDPGHDHIIGVTHTSNLIPPRFMCEIVCESVLEAV